VNGFTNKINCAAFHRGAYLGWAIFALIGAFRTKPLCTTQIGFGALFLLLLNPQCQQSRKNLILVEKATKFSGLMYYIIENIRIYQEEAY
jgi:predicted branched-subunit amino acid permease